MSLYLLFFLSLFSFIKTKTQKYLYLFLFLVYFMVFLFSLQKNHIFFFTLIYPNAYIDLHSFACCLSRFYFFDFYVAPNIKKK
jgi:hypothetical protein